MNNDLWRQADPGPMPLRPLTKVEGKFPLGQTVMTSGVADRAAQDIEFLRFCIDSLRRHAEGDWGDLSDDDKARNDEDLRHGERLLSAYEKPDCPKIWVITEWDRSVTTTLFPDEY